LDEVPGAGDKVAKKEEHTKCFEGSEEERVVLEVDFELAEELDRLPSGSYANAADKSPEDSVILKMKKAKDEVEGKTAYEVEKEQVLKLELEDLSQLESGFSLDHYRCS
jgi:hypothetical protein